MLLEKIEINNIRAHKHIVFEPELKGITAISGNNGAGKSTIVDSFSWCLFGTKYQGLNNKKYIRENVDPKKEKVSVTTYIIVGNMRYKIERTIVSGDGKMVCNVYSKGIKSTKDYSLESGPTVSHAEKYIRSILGLDEKGFLSSVFIKQKQVDSIITASSRERGQIIEGLIGVSSITKAIELSKEQNKELQKAANVIHLGSIKEEKEKIELQKQKVIELQKQIKEKESEKETLTKDIQELSECYEREEVKQKEKTVIKNKMAVLEREIKLMSEQVETSLNILDTLKISNSSRPLKTYVEEYNKLDEEIRSVIVERVRVNREIEEYTKIFDKEIQKDIVRLHSDNENKLNNILNALNALADHIVITKNSMQHQELFLKDLEKGIVSCPVCSHKIQNNEETREKHTKELKSIKDILKQKEKEYKDLEKEYNNALNASIKLKEELDIYVEQIEKKEYYTSILRSYRALNKKIEVLESNKEELNKHIAQAKLNESNKNTIASLKTSIKENQKSIKEKTKENNTYKKELEHLSCMTDNDFHNLFKNLEQAKKRHTDVEITIAKLLSERELSKHTGKELVKNLENIKIAVKEYNKLARKITSLNLTEKELLGFRENRIKESIPALSEIASSLLERFTSGRFREVICSPKFEILVVTKDGQTRPVEALSGGELSAVAIALRIAIAIFLHSKNESLLVLDEVLISMSEDTSNIILETIREITGSQIIFISHSQSITQIADKVFHI